MGFYDLADRINWEQACRVLGVQKSTLFRWVKEGRLAAYGAGERNRFFLKSECLRLRREREAKRGRRRGSASGKRM